MPSLNETELKLQQRALCPECGATRVRSSTRYLVCPNGHGRLKPKLTIAEVRRANELMLPLATTTGGKGRYKRFAIEGQDDVWCWRDAAGTRRIEPGKKVANNTIIARYRRSRGHIVRLFTLVPAKNTNHE